MLDPRDHTVLFLSASQSGTADGEITTIARFETETQWTSHHQRFLVSSVIFSVKDNDEVMDLHVTFAQGRISHKLIK